MPPLPCDVPGTRARAALAGRANGRRPDGLGAATGLTRTGGRAVACPGRHDSPGRARSVTRSPRRPAPVPYPDRRYRSTSTFLVHRHCFSLLAVFLLPLSSLFYLGWVQGAIVATRHCRCEGFISKPRSNNV